MKCLLFLVKFIYTVVFCCVREGHYASKHIKGYSLK